MPHHNPFLVGINQIINNEHFAMNALLVPDPNPAFKIKTWLRQIGITVKGAKKRIQLVFTAATSEVTINKKGLH